MITNTLSVPGPDLQGLLVRFGAPVVGVAIALTSQGDGPTLCPIRLCTGHACPGCGLTRSIGAAARGDLALSWRYHPLALLVVLQLVVLWAVLTFGSLSADRQRRLPALVAGNTVLLIGVWLVRWKLGLLDFVIAS